MICSLVWNVAISKHLRVLNLRGKGIGADCTDSICELIDLETVLEQFYIGTNFLTAKSGARIFDLMSKNKNIKVFDYSLNNLGED